MLYSRFPLAPFASFERQKVLTAVNWAGDAIAGHVTLYDERPTMFSIQWFTLPVLMWAGFSSFSMAVDGAEAEKEWTALFDGKDLTAWDPNSISRFDEWVIKEDVLSTNRSGSGWLKTLKEYDDFELRLEFRMSAGSNSGVFLRADGGTPHVYGLEVQLLDDGTAASPPNSNSCGALLLESGPKVAASKKAGEWQSLYVRCEGPKVTVKLNDRLIINEDLKENTEREAAHPGRKSHRGKIGLQHRGEIVDFRKIEVRSLK
jgi:hypothetical protein